jgi:Arc/MetJ-type ribon-helix-helix transcriptional regulator
MPKPPHPDLPEDVARYANALVAAGRYASVQDVLRAGLDALQDDDEETATRDVAAWADYQARRPADPRDLNAAEALACLHSDDPEKRKALRSHLEAIGAAMDAGAGAEMNDAAFCTFLDAELAEADRRRA